MFRKTHRCIECLEREREREREREIEGERERESFIRKFLEIRKRQCPRAFKK